MTEHQRLFLVQAQSDFVVFELLLERTELPCCHALHYLQMATEMLGKALAWKHGLPRKSHRAIVRFLRNLESDRNAQRRLGFQNKNAKWSGVIRAGLNLASSIEDLAPALSNGPNPEYPWPSDGPHTAPVEHDFEVWRALREEVKGRQFLALIKAILAAADSFL